MWIFDCRVTIGIRLLCKLGWKEGQGVGPRVRKKRRQKRGILKIIIYFMLICLCLIHSYLCWFHFHKMKFICGKTFEYLSENLRLRMVIKFFQQVFIFFSFILLIVSKFFSISALYFLHLLCVQMLPMMLDRRSMAVLCLQATEMTTLRFGCHMLLCNKTIAWTV